MKKSCDPRRIAPEFPKEGAIVVVQKEGGHEILRKGVSSKLPIYLSSASHVGV
jgi:hypothetical protein